MNELDELVLAKVQGRKIEVKAVSNKISVEDKFNRGILNEGRNYGLGFAFIKKESEDKYKALMAFTACKDYLNDFVYVEGTGKALGNAHGFKHEYVGIFKDKDHFYLGLKPLHRNHGGVYAGFDSVDKLLRDNHKNILTFLNKLEEELGCKDLSKFEAYDLESKTLIFKAPIFWTKFSFMFSMYGLLIRCFMNVTEEDLKQSAFDMIINKKGCAIPEDGSLLLSCQKYFKNFSLEKLLDFKYQEPAQPYTIHNMGIVGRLANIK